MTPFNEPSNRYQATRSGSSGGSTSVVAESESGLTVVDGSMVDDVAGPSVAELSSPIVLVLVSCATVTQELESSSSTTQRPARPAPACEPYRCPDSHEGSGKLQNPVG
jgi:hypothetical protein